MNYNYHEQTCDCYRSEYYGWNTIFNSACGPASLCNALDALGLGSHTVREMCKYAVSVGARVDGGTDMHRLLSKAGEKFGFTYRATSKNAELLEHLKNGGTAILNNGEEYKLFSSGGHFVAAVKVSDGNTITVLDSYWYAGKYTQTALRANNVKVIERGVVQTSLEQCGKATGDRDPSYYLISKKKPKVKLIEDAPIRSKPSKDAKKVGYISKGETVELLEESKGCNWYRIKSGWIAAKKCKKI